MSMTENEIIKMLEVEKAYMDSHGGRSQSEALAYAIESVKEIQQYRAIGTIEEFKDLKEKAEPKKIKGIRFAEAICPKCESELFETYWAFGGIHNCSNCGQSIDWQ